MIKNTFFTAAKYVENVPPHCQKGICVVTFIINFYLFQIVLKFLNFLYKNTFSIFFNWYLHLRPLINQWLNQSIPQSTNPLINHSLNQSSLNQSLSIQWITHWINRSLNQSFNFIHKADTMSSSVEEPQHLMHILTTGVYPVMTVTDIRSLGSAVGISKKVLWSLFSVDK